DARQILRWLENGEWRGMDWPQLAGRVREVAAGLIALGIQPGDRVALMSNTRMEWTVADLAILAAGAVTVPLYETSSVEQCAWVLSDSGAKAAIAATPDHAKQLDAARGQAPDFGELFVVEDGGLDSLAERASAGHLEQVAERAAAVTTADNASIIYTSGTTGNPKGCLLSHGNVLSTARQTETVLPELFAADESTLLFLPLAHVFGRIGQFACLESNTQLGFARSVETLVDDLATFRPTFLLSVPRVFEKVFNAAQRKAEGPKRKVFDFAVATSRQWATAPHPGPVTNLKRAVADRLVYSKLRAALGGRVRYCVSGGAPLAEHLAYFFNAAGITLLEAYGLSETSAASALNSPSKMRLGTVGRPNAGSEFRVAADGELLQRGPGVFAGYWQNDKATAEVLDDDGWFHTGDLGEIDDDGYITITGRKKEIIVTAGGKNVAPAVLEERLKSHHLVSQAVVVGDNRAFVAALVTLDPDELAAFAKTHELSGSPAELTENQTVRAEVDTAVERANQAVSRAESIRRVAVLPRDFTIEDGEMTPTLKLKRAAIAEHFADEIEELYH
ncbi:MAG: AMP-dependent synthetase/ligase, partial [Actinomycetota bacterium]|nr:AMP-dependent synthetase/ligase [Actinomycetota bacterium]